MAIKINKAMIIYKINFTILFSLLTLSMACDAANNTEKSNNHQKMRVTDYFAYLPERYITYTGDISSLETIIDTKNGYIVKREKFHPDIIWFELALFRQKTGEAVIVISNRQSDCVCNTYETFFLKYDGKKWQDVSKKVLPPIQLISFFDLQSELFHKALALLKSKPSMIEYHYKLPQHGTVIELSLEICDVSIESNFNETEQKILWPIFLEENNPSNKTLCLQWNKKTGQFELD